jgi:hypothetical protein
MVFALGAPPPNVIEKFGVELTGIRYSMIRA